MFQAASISKPVAAMAAMRAVQDGRFGLDDDINTLLKSWKLPDSEFTRGHPVTPRSLMSHTSASATASDSGISPVGTRPTLVEILNGSKPSNVGRVRMERAPFTAAKYSGGGVTLMQLAMMDALGRPYADMMQEVVLGPSDDEQRVRAAAVGRTRRPRAPGARRRRTRHGCEVARVSELAAAGLWTTPETLRGSRSKSRRRPSAGRRGCSRARACSRC
jgi:CubicO group peptidase (beta-lactamase class C family)